METIFKFIDNVERYSLSTWILLIALFIVFISIFERDKKHAQVFGFSVRGIIKWRIFAIGFLFLFISQFANVSDVFIERKIKANSLKDRLVENQKVNWLIRIIPYNSNEVERLSIDKLEYLGNPAEKYVFVADYEELRNYTIQEAIYKLGGRQKKFATLIIFPLQENLNDTVILYPASCRGVLQVIKEIDSLHTTDTIYKKFHLKGLLSLTEQENLEDKEIPSWNWKYYNKYYNSYTHAIDLFINGDFSAKQFIGKIESDWNPVGVSTVKSNNKSLQNSFTLSTPDNEIKINNIGARAFLFPNLKLKDIKRKILIDIEVNNKNRIPDIGGKFNEL
jgi:hypothetical protein